MDAAISLEGVAEALGCLLTERDYEGAEELLSMALANPGHASPRDQAFLHLSFGKLYRTWGKLTSSINHLNLSAELAHRSTDRILLIQVVEELKATRQTQGSQRP